MTKNCAARIVLSLLMACVTAQAEDQHFQVQQWCFCKGIDVAHRAPINCLSDPAEARGKDKLYLWMRISVNQNGIRYLRALHQLPIYHAWGRNGWIEGSTINIGIDEKTWQDEQRGIEEEIGLRKGTFDWRTYSQKVRYIYDGQHYVSVLDANHHPVVLSSEQYEAFRPAIQINVKGN